MLAHLVGIYGPTHWQTIAAGVATKSETQVASFVVVAVVVAQGGRNVLLLLLFHLVCRSGIDGVGCKVAVVSVEDSKHFLVYCFSVPVFCRVALVSLCCSGGISNLCAPHTDAFLVGHNRFFPTLGFPCYRLSRVLPCDRFAISQWRLRC